MTVPTIGDYNTGVQASGSTSFIFSVPVHSAGDVIYVAIAQDGVGVMTQASFTALYNNIDINGTATFCLFYRTATDAEPATYTVTTTLSERAVWIVWVVSNDGGINAQGANSNGVSSMASIGAPTTTVDNCLIFQIVATDLVSTPMSGGGTELAETSFTSAASIGVYYRELATAGVGTGNVITLGASEDWITVNFAIAPGSFVPPEPPAIAVPVVQRIRTYLP